MAASAERIGFVGLGNMGGPMATNLATKGHQVTVLDRVPARSEKVAAAGAAIAPDLQALIGRSDILVTMLPDTPDVEAVVAGPDGLLRHGRPGMLHLDTSTIAPEASRSMAERLGQAGIAFVDAGVGRSPAHAERGECLFMVGATDADLARIMPVLEAMGTKIIHAGPPGSGIGLKIVNNYVAMCLCQLNAEAFTLAAKLGLPARTLFEVMTNSLSSNDHLKLYWPTKALAGDIEPGFALDLAYKDLSIGVGAAAAVGAPAHVGTAVRAAMERARSELGLGGRDVTALLQAAADEAGIEAPRL
ncbi:4-hydroxybutyrate dehydrogenase/sulfolactaldehyde 3-reductase [Stella humosa]|uniref:4-hydroxybutyrate dehydrogenase/sulfolactaldehyde 3-reductase n=1 Tax=Stella humosa TaxID=94 RepID=A0A3N1MDK5_9PROT|nr:NAD(P)-dependent oxidoreductase [Stella humosa]ROQ01195.1 4-hydroxybutyrate dehydrogenase/sulfolactaldehyde 3-reductase [Stella humosa]BBK31569.1 tartronate semialdehyde reductase [Stella humosa]